MSINAHTPQGTIPSNQLTTPSKSIPQHQHQQGDRTSMATTRKPGAKAALLTFLTVIAVARASGPKTFASKTAPPSLCALKAECVHCFTGSDLSDCTATVTTRFEEKFPKAKQMACGRVPIATDPVPGHAGTQSHSVECLGFEEFVLRSRELRMERSDYFVEGTKRALLLMLRKTEVQSIGHGADKAEYSITDDGPKTGTVSLGNNRVPNAVMLTIRSNKGKRREAVRMAVSKMWQHKAWNQIWEKIRLSRVSRNGLEFIVIIQFKNRYEKELS